MPGPPAESPIKLSPRQEELLLTKIRVRGCPQGLAQRVRIVLSAAAGHANERIARDQHTTGERVRRWRKRWRELDRVLEEAEKGKVSDRDLLDLMVGGLSDRPRPGAPATFSAEQVARIIGVACEKPEISGRPISHWSPSRVSRRREPPHSLRVHPEARFLAEPD